MKVLWVGSCKKEGGEIKHWYPDKSLYFTVIWSSDYYSVLDLLEKETFGEFDIVVVGDEISADKNPESKEPYNTANLIARIKRGDFKPAIFPWAPVIVLMTSSEKYAPTEMLLDEANDCFCPIDLQKINEALLRSSEVVIQFWKKE